MYYLGIAGGISISHDPSACLVKDGKIIAMAEEERFIRQKHARQIFPKNAIAYCLKEGGVTLKDVKVGFNFKPELFSFVPRRTSIKFFPHRFVGTMMRKNEIANIANHLKKNFKFKPDVECVEHHITHVYSAFPLSGFKKANCFSMDGVGEETATLVTSCEGDSVEKLQEHKIPNSLGNFYGFFTEWLGFRMNNGEGKVMGLAAYGEPKYDLSKFARYKKGKHFVNGSSNRSDFNHLFNRIVRTFGDKRRGEIEKIHKDVAASLQVTLEKIVLNMVEHHNSKNICLAGGVALNCLMNGRIRESGLVDKMYIQPVANDAGCALGAAVYMSMMDGHKFKKMEHIYYGPGFSNAQIKKDLDTVKVNYDYYKDIEGIVAELLSKGNMIGWFQGRMGVGPRALGNRSILADPTDKKMKDKINKTVKYREDWRPFAPSLLEDKAKKYLVNAQPSPFMIVTFDVKPERVDEIPAIMHIDNTCRPQTVNKKTNKKYYNMIKQFGKETGTPVVLNTSFNIRGEPIVCSPFDAIRCFFGTGLDYLAIGNYLVKKGK